MHVTRTSQTRAASSQDYHIQRLTQAILLEIGLAAMFLLSGGRAEKYAYHAETEEGDEAAKEAVKVETEVSTFG